MAKVWNPLFSGDVSGAFGKKFIYKKGGIVTRMFSPKNPRTVLQQAHRIAFRNYYMASLTQAQADLLYAAIIHQHDDLYSLFGHGHDHGDLSGLADDDHTQYYNQARGDGRYLRSVPQQDHGGLAGLGDDDHSQYYNQARGDARYLQSVPQQDHGGLAGLSDNDHPQYYLATKKVPLVFGGHGNGGTVAAGATAYIVPYIAGLDTAGRSAPMPIAGTVKNLYVRLASTQPASGSLVITLNDVTTGTSLGIVVTIAAGSGGATYSDLTHTSAFNAGNLIQAQVKNNASAASGILGGVTFEYDVSLV